MPRTIRWKLILSISIPLLVTYLGMLAWDYHRQRAAAVAQMQQLVLERAESAAARVDARLAGVMQVAHSIASGMENRPNLTAQQSRMLLPGAMRQAQGVAAVYGVVVDPGPPGGEVRSQVIRRGGGSGGGGERWRGPGGPGGPGGPVRAAEYVMPDGAEPAWYQQARTTRAAAWSPPHDEPTPAAECGDNATRRVATYAVPVLSGDDVRGVIAVSVAMDELLHVRRFPGAGGSGGGGGDPRLRVNRDDADVPPSQPPTRAPRPDEPPPPTTLPTDLIANEAGQPLRDFAILDAGGFVIVAPADAPEAPSESIFDVAKKIGRHDLNDAARDALGGHSRVVRVAGLHEVIGTVTTDRYHWIALSPIASTGWALVSVIPESETMAPILARIAQRGAFLLGGSVVLLLIVLAVAIRISRPIEQMAGAVDRLAAGDLDVQVTGIRSRDEMGRLANGFNQMTRQLKAHVAELTAQTAAREKVESELRIARQIQTDMLPKTFPPFPERPEFDLHAINLPARRVAGDFYDFFFAPGGLLTVVIADVSGKGVPAALLMAVTRTIVRNLAMSGLGPASIAERANEMLIADTSRGMFVTMLLLQYDPATGRLTYVNAGHPPPVRLTPGEPPQQACDRQSPLLGVDATGEMGSFEQGEATLMPGESLFCYTDGVPDARAPDRTMFGDARLLDALRRSADLPPEPLCRAVAEELEQYEAGARQDDITLLVLRRSRPVTA